MRTFDEFELSFLNRIKLLNENNIELSFLSLLDDFLLDKGFIIEQDRRKVYFLFDGLKFSRIESNSRTPQHSMEAEVRLLTTTIIRLIIFIQYLEKEGRIFKIQSNKKLENLIAFARIENDVTPIKIEVSDIGFSDLFCSYVNQYIFINDRLLYNIETEQNISDIGERKTFQKADDQDQKILDNNTILLNIDNNLSENLVIMEDFLQVSERRSKLADIALAVAIFLGIMCIGVTGISTYYTFRKLDEVTEITGLKFEPINNSMVEIEKGIAKVNDRMDNLAKRDTIHARIIQSPYDTFHAKVVNFPPPMIQKKIKPFRK